MSTTSEISRVQVAALDAIIGQRFNVLDDGFVRVIDYMGSDDAIVQAARVSYGVGTKHYHEDRGLIRYLIRHRHTTPFEMCELKLHVRVPMDCWRQWIRHRTANVNEYSTRYSVAIDAAQRTAADSWRLQSAGNRQGSNGKLDQSTGEQLTQQETELLDHARRVYEERLAVGVAREQARKDLTLSTYTEAYWKVDLHNLLHFLALRMDAHAQHEIRQYALLIGSEIVSKWCPVAWEAFLEYRVNGTELSRVEIEIIRAVAVSPQQALTAAISAGFLNEDGTRRAKSRELEELETKLQVLGLQPPWSAR